MLLRVAHLTLRRGAREVVHGLDLELEAGQRLALVGRNGSGKSTLLDALAGARDAWVEGQVRRAPGVWWARVAQDEAAPAPDATLRDLAAEALAPLRALGDELAAAAPALGPAPSAAALEAYGALHAAFEARGGYTAERDLDEALTRLGLGDAARRPAAAASGGERRRARLAGAVASGADLLLLDEPTNHLDLEARDWLAARLGGHRGAVVFASHDRAWIDAVATHLVPLDAPGAQVRRGGWTAWARARALADAQDAKAARLRARRVAELESMAAELRAQGHRAAHVRRRRAEREAAELRTAPAATPTETAPRVRLGRATAGGEIARFEHLTCGHVVDDAGLVLHAGDRWALVGPNGSGKSTLLRLLAGELASEDPRARSWWRPGTRVVYLDQHGRGLADDATPRTALTTWVSGPRAEGLAALMGLARDALDRPVATLSGGERARAAAALLMAREADVLLLDEPTNDLDVTAIEALEGALATTAATVVVATHDARTIEALGAEVVTLVDGRPVRWRGGLAGWRRGARRLEPGVAGATDAIEPGAVAASLGPDAPPNDGTAGASGAAGPAHHGAVGTATAVADHSASDADARDAERTAADVALDDPVRWTDRDRARFRRRRRALEEALIAAAEARLPPARAPFRTREGGWVVWGEPSVGGLHVWLDGGETDPAAHLQVRVLSSDGRKVAHLAPDRLPDRAPAPWAWRALTGGAARLAVYVHAVDAVQVASERPPGDGFAPWAPGWWWRARTDVEREEGWGPERPPRPRRRRRRRRSG